MAGAAGKAPNELGPSGALVVVVVRYKDGMAVLMVLALLVFPPPPNMESKEAPVDCDCEG
jgi:hypothetical protein